VTPRTAHVVLSDVIAQDPDRLAHHDRSSLATAEVAADTAQSIQQPLDQLTAEVTELTAGRTGVLLDRLAAQGAITDGQREALAADAAYGSLEQVLRTAEVAGHDPCHVLAGAVAAQPLDTAVTRNAAVCAREALKARGVDPDAAADRVTAAEWLEAHRAEQHAEDPHREVRDEHEVADDAVATDTTEATLRVAADAERATREPILETAVPDVRDASVPDATEATDPTQLRRVPTADETAAAVARAQAALAEIAARERADAAREAEHTAEVERSEELARWAEQDRAAEVEQTTVADADDELVLER